MGVLLPWLKKNVVIAVCPHFKWQCQGGSQIYHPLVFCKGWQLMAAEGCGGSHRFSQVLLPVSDEDLCSILSLFLEALCFSLAP